MQGYLQLMHLKIAVANLYKIHDSAAEAYLLLRHKSVAWAVMQKQVRFSRGVVQQFVVDSLSGCDGFSFRSWNFPFGPKHFYFAGFASLQGFFACFHWSVAAALAAPASPGWWACPSEAGGAAPMACSGSVVFVRG